MILENCEILRSAMLTGICLGSWNSDTIHKVHIHIDTQAHTYIHTTQTNIGTGTSHPHTHRSGTQSSANTPSGLSHQGASHHSKPQSAAEERPEPLPPSHDSWSPQDPGKLSHHPP